MSVIQTIEELEAVYGTPREASLVKEVDFLSEGYRAFVEAAPFAVLATVGPEGLDCSPRGDGPGFLRIVDERTLVLPDRRGNNRVDSLRNVVRDPRVALLLMVPGSGSTLRINGQARVDTDPDLLASFEVAGKQPRSVLVIRIEAVYFQCSRAIMRAKLWDPSAQHDPKSLPSAGTMLAELTDGRVGGKAYDEAWPKRAKESLW